MFIVDSPTRKEGLPGGETFCFFFPCVIAEQRVLSLFFAFFLYTFFFSLHFQEISDLERKGGEG